MSIQRKIEQFRPLIESGYYEHVTSQKAPPSSPEWPGWEQRVRDLHVTLRIDIAKLTHYMAKKAANSRSGRSQAFGGFIRLTINTSKERE